MIKRLTEKIANQKQSYNFKQSNGVAGICPDCGGIVSFNSYHQRYQCSQVDCCFEADIKKQRVWDNEMRDQNLQQIKKEGVVI